MTHAQTTFDRLDRLSRERALTEAESRDLQRAIRLLNMQKSMARVGGWSADQDARFADAIAEGASIGRAAQLVGKTKNAGIGRFRRMKEALGWQAQ